uniref:Uncharacterized protein n=1 Tax=Pseudomonas syringae pv. actinidiae TaxID=103796 RepID=M1J6D0_PSESF|nr:hypothetical protein [Pseudomonas syringae pv. actinidiae]AGE82509.1 hypothetical protein [Pseudomonas syringae pv. actinidiae]
MLPTSNARAIVEIHLMQLLLSLKAFSVDSVVFAEAGQLHARLLVH